MVRFLADNNVVGHVEDLVQEMRSPRWADFWVALGLALVYFRDVGLSATSTDRQIWRVCQAEQLLLITNTRNRNDPDSLEATLRDLNAPDSLPVFTISDVQSFRTDRAYAERVVESLYDYIIDIETCAARDDFTCPN